MARRVALLPIGAYEPRKLMSYVHMNPQDAVHAHLDFTSTSVAGNSLSNFSVNG